MVGALIEALTLPYCELEDEIDGYNSLQNKLTKRDCKSVFAGIYGLSLASFPKILPSSVFTSVVANGPPIIKICSVVLVTFALMSSTF